MEKQQNKKCRTYFVFIIYIYLCYRKSRQTSKYFMYNEKKKKEILYVLIDTLKKCLHKYLIIFFSSPISSFNSVQIWYFFSSIKRKNVPIHKRITVGIRYVKSKN